jgi:FtsZ-interacting cell division protein ZipA
MDIVNIEPEIIKQESFFQTYKYTLIIGAVILLIVLIVVYLYGRKTAEVPEKKEEPPAELPATPQTSKLEDARNKLKRRVGFKNPDADVEAEAEPVKAEPAKAKPASAKSPKVVVAVKVLPNVVRQVEETVPAKITEVAQEEPQSEPEPEPEQEYENNDFSESLPPISETDDEPLY